MQAVLPGFRWFVGIWLHLSDILQGSFWSHVAGAREYDHDQWKWELWEEEEGRVDRWRERVAERMERGREELSKAYEILPYPSDKWRTLGMIWNRRRAIWGERILDDMFNICVNSLAWTWSKCQVPHIAGRVLLFYFPQELPHQPWEHLWGGQLPVTFLRACVPSSYR